jgi:hypothetical protein
VKGERVRRDQNLQFVPHRVRLHGNTQFVPHRITPFFSSDRQRSGHTVSGGGDDEIERGRRRAAARMRGDGRVGEEEDGLVAAVGRRFG